MKLFNSAFFLLNPETIKPAKLFLSLYNMNVGNKKHLSAATIELTSGLASSQTR